MNDIIFYSIVAILIITIPLSFFFGTKYITNMGNESNNTILKIIGFFIFNKLILKYSGPFRFKDGFNLFNNLSICYSLCVFIISSLPTMDAMIRDIVIVNIIILFLSIFVGTLGFNFFITMMLSSVLFIVGIIWFVIQLTSGGLCSEIKEALNNPMSDAGSKIMKMIILPILFIAVVWYETKWYCVAESSKVSEFKRIRTIGPMMILNTIIYLIIMCASLYLNNVLNYGGKEKIKFSSIKDPYNTIIILCMLFPLYSYFFVKNYPKFS